MNEQEIFDKVCMINQTTYNNEPINAEGYMNGVISIESPQITTGMFEELIKNFRHVWFDGGLKRIVIGDFP